MPIRVYLAARYGRREELAGYRDQLRRMGFEVTSRWLDTPASTPDDGVSAPRTVEEGRRWASADFDDVWEADVLIYFANGAPSRGGCHVEFGMALALDHKLIVVGPRENVFHCLPRVHHCESWPAALFLLGKWQQEGLHHETTPPPAA